MIKTRKMSLKSKILILLFKKIRELQNTL